MVAKFSSIQEEAVCDVCHSKIKLADLLSINNSDLSQTRTADASMALAKPGEKISHFRIEKLLGFGGFGCVYEAYDTVLERKVALKLPRMMKLDARMARNFVREARAAAKLKNSNIVSVYEIGRVEDQVYIVSELIEGETLKDWCESNAPGVIEKACLISKIAHALDSAHDAGVIHRDVKPGNVIVDAIGEPHITDFGLAIRVGDDDDPLAKTGRIVGTLPYMSPEQALGKSDEADRRTDIYSLGIMLYEMLVGKRPFRGESDPITEEIIQGNAVHPHNIDRSVDLDISAICMKAIAKRPADRFQTAREMAEDLERFVAGRPIKIRPQGKLEQVRKFARNNLVGLATAFTILVLFGLLAVNSIYGVRSNPSPPVLVSFRVKPARADVLIAKVDGDLGRVDVTRAIQPTRISDTAGFEVELEPGFYIVEAYSPGLGVQEVRRTVSTTPNRRIDYRHSNWFASKPRNKRQGHIRWPDIEITKTPIASRPGDSAEVSGIEFVRIAGLRTDPSRSDQDSSNADQRDFLISSHEINAGQYRRVMKKLPPAMIQQFKQRDIPENKIPDSEIVTYLTYFDVLAFCERTGCRPMLLDEYLTIATNGGTTKFPWGNSPPADWLQNWGSQNEPSVRPNVLQYPAVTGVYTGELEWTQEYELPINPQTGKPFGEPMVSGFGGDARVVVDGPPQFAHGFAFDDQTIFDDVRQKTWLKPASGYPHVGFRCAISIQPRLKPAPDK